MKAVPTIRKQYVDCRYGQLHVRRAGEGDQTPLVCLHMSPYSGLFYEPFMQAAAQTRLVVCPDTPGYGGSDAVGGQPAIDDYAGAIIDMLDTLGVMQVDVLGFHTGSFIAAATAHKAPDRVRKLVLPGLPYVEEEGRAARREMFRGPRPYFSEDGYLQKRWDTGMKARGGQADDRFIALFAETLRAGVDGMNKGFAAVFSFDPDAVLPLLKQPVFIPVPDEMLAENSRVAAGLFQDAAVEEWPDLKGDMFDVAAGDVWGRIMKWLDE